MRALSTSYYYQLVYNSYSSTTTNGTLSFVDILTDRHNANITTNIVRANEMADTAFIGYGQYFDVDSDGMAYVSAHSDYNTTLVNPINTVRLCTHNQKYDSLDQNLLIDIVIIDHIRISRHDRSCMCKCWRLRHIQEICSRICLQLRLFEQPVWQELRVLQCIYEKTWI